MFLYMKITQIIPALTVEFIQFLPEDSKKAILPHARVGSQQSDIKHKKSAQFLIAALENNVQYLLEIGFTDRQQAYTDFSLPFPLMDIIGEILSKQTPEVSNSRDN